MAQYVVHKIGFFFNDDNFEIGKENGNITAITRSLEEARAIKHKADIESMKTQAGYNAVIFFLENPNYKEIYRKLGEYYNSEFGMYISQTGITLLPPQINDEQAAQFLVIMELTFHTIVEYDDDEVIDPAAFELDYSEYCCF
jgi:hypothetical protein